MYGQYTVPNANDFMSLGVGQPSPDILLNGSEFISYPIEDHNVLQYGMKNGFLEFRELVCKLIKNYTNHSIDKNNVYMTNGITQAIFMLASFLKESNYKTVYVEDLTYFIIINIFKDIGFKIKSFDINNLNKLEDNLKNETEPSLIYLIPFCNNPTGKTILSNTLYNICQLINKYNVLVLSDETYQFLHYSTNNENKDIIENKPLAIYSNKIISLGTFSKILVPGIRLGWIYTQDNIIINNKLINLSKWIDDTGFMDSGGSVNPTIAYMVVNNLNEKFYQYENFLTNIVVDLQKKSNLILNVLSRYPDYFEPIYPDGGYFVFVKSKKLNSARLLELANKCGFNFHCGNKFTILNNQQDTFRLSVSYYSLSDYESWFEKRIWKLINMIRNELLEISNISLLGNGKLGKLIYFNIENNSNINDNKPQIISKELNIEYINTNNYSFHTIIDVSSPEGTNQLIEKLTNKSLFPRLIIGTTGHSDEQMNKIKIYSKFAPVFYCSNFSQNIQGFINIINNLSFKPSQIEITEIHHTEKKDVPSGTAKLLKTHLESKYPNINIDIISERIGNEVGTHIIKLISNNESIELKHKALNRNIFAIGCVDLLEKISKSQKGFYLNNFESKIK